MKMPALWDCRKDSGIDPDTGLWLPPRGLQRYQWMKSLGGLLFSTAFLAWTALAWPRLPTTLCAPLLAAITLWITFRSVWRDRSRCAGRQLQVTPDAILLTTPVASTRVRWEDVCRARWMDGEVSSHGLWLYGEAGRPLAHIDRAFLADQSEAREFLGWARRHAALSFPVAWQ